MRPLRRTAVALTLLLAVAWALFHLSRARTWQAFGTLVARIETDQPLVSLTFDDGPTPEHTDGILAALAAHRARATFFLIGADVVRSPELVRRILAAGHEVGNHSYTHERMVLKSMEFYRHEVDATDAALARAGATGPFLFRPPFCKKLFGLPWHLWRTGRTSVTWDVEPETDPAVAADPAAIVADVRARVRPGSIVLLHAMYPVREPTRRALPGILALLDERGLRSVPVSELRRAARP